jgi:hypothetical protein
MNKEKEFTSYDTQGPTDFDHVGFHLSTIEDLLKLIHTCHNLIPLIENRYDTQEELPITSEKLDELKQYTSKLKRYVGDGPFHVYHSQPLPKGGIDIIKQYPV